MCLNTSRLLSSWWIDNISYNSLTVSVNLSRSQNSMKAPSTKGMFADIKIDLVAMVVSMRIIKNVSTNNADTRIFRGSL